MTKVKKSKFKTVFLIYLAILLIFALAVIIHVNSLLEEYEAAQPERLIEQVCQELQEEASNGTLLSKYPVTLPDPQGFEKGKDIYAETLKQFTEGELTYSKALGVHEENELLYNVENKGFPLAQVKLISHGPIITKLAVFTYRNWEIAEISLLSPENSYELKLKVPANYIVKLWGNLVDESLPKSLGISDDYLEIKGNDKDAEYVFCGIHLVPAFEIYDVAGNKGEYSFHGEKIVPEIYNYSLKLPKAMVVKLNGNISNGENYGQQMLYDFRFLAPQTVEVSDFYGNSVLYDGQIKLALTSTQIITPEDYTVSVNGQAVPEKAVSTAAMPDHEALVPYADNLPKVSLYDIAILDADAEIEVMDEKGNLVSLDMGQEVQNLVPVKAGLEEVPAEIAAEVDVLEVAQKWSLFMSQDLEFSALAKHLIKSSYQYDVARAYATGVDITFMSKHTLMNPPFTDISVSNFVWISENCFSVDISFIKHMRILGGRPVEDHMNDRFYFVKYDDTDNGRDDAKWKLISMKEILDNAE